MKYLNYKSEYDKNPVIQITKNNGDIDQGKLEIIKKLSDIQSGILVFETYPGVDLTVLKNEILEALHGHIVNIEDYTKTESEIDLMLSRNLTEDRVFGLVSHHRIEDFYPTEKISELNIALKQMKGLVIVYGFGASQIDYDHLIYVGLTRWEIQLRYRNGLSNFKKNNPKEDILKKYKRGYFIEWRVADQIKENTIHEMIYYIDYTNIKKPGMISKNSYDQALDITTNKPFRMVPYFDPGVWGGHWMKEVCGLNPLKKNYAWSFDGVPEENSIALGFGDRSIEIPAQDLVQFRPVNLMGNRVHARFGKHFPIRFDLLDTMGGGNLSLQVHPLTEYIFEEFGMPFTQDESYYILDAEPDGTVYLGFKENIDQKSFRDDLLKAEKGMISFDAEKYVNLFSAKKHDHYLIPAGTVHCSGKNTMVLEISATSYIFTFKMWDWNRLGMDGLPRPVHLKHAFKSVQYERDTTYVKDQLINHIVKINEHEEITGLHEREFLETRRFTFKDDLIIKTLGSVNMANLVGGKMMEIQSMQNEFEPYIIHYAETFVIPATINEFKVKCMDENGCILIKAHVR